jgi:hypothetical protein
LPAVEFLPSLERARLLADSPGIVATNPRETFAAAAIVLQTDAIRREIWDDDVEMSEALFQKYPRGLVPAPSLYLLEDLPPSPVRSATVNYKMIPDESVAKRLACTSCSITRGQVFCPTCDGSGRAASDDILATCTACNASGMITCAACDGTTITITTKIRYISDHGIHLRRTFVPNMGKLAAKVNHRIDALATWNMRFSFEPAPQIVASAYRGASAVREPDFHGFHFGDALPRTLEAIAELASDTTLVHQQSHCFAVPLLWLVYGPPEQTTHVVLVAQPDGSLVCVST